MSLISIGTFVAQNIATASSSKDLPTVVAQVVVADDTEEGTIFSLFALKEAEDNYGVFFGEP